jgi:hypothetical protein
MIIPISKTAVTSKLTLCQVDTKDLCKEYEERPWTGLLRIDLPQEISTILGTRYIHDQPWDKVNVYKHGEKTFSLSLEPFTTQTPTYESEVYKKHRKGINPKTNSFDDNQDAQFIVVPDNMFSEGSYVIEMRNDTEELPRHMMCCLVQ